MSKEEAKKGEYLRHEIAYGAFEWRLTVPEGVQADKIKAEFKNGVVDWVLSPSCGQISCPHRPAEAAFRAVAVRRNSRVGRDGNGTKPKCL